MGVDGWHRPLCMELVIWDNAAALARPIALAASLVPCPLFLHARSAPGDFFFFGSNSKYIYGQAASAHEVCSDLRTYAVDVAFSTPGMLVFFDDACGALSLEDGIVPGPAHAPLYIYLVGGLLAAGHFSAVGARAFLLRLTCQPLLLFSGRARTTTRARRSGLP